MNYLADHEECALTVESIEITHNSTISEQPVSSVLSSVLFSYINFIQ